MNKIKIKKLVILGCDYKRTLEFSDGFVFYT